MDYLISKREVLEKYNISYGALYRWKRLGLIPEDWFIKKSTVIGQETFLKKAQICQRVELILNRDENTSLEELSEILASKQKQQQSQRRLILDNGFECFEFSLEELKKAVLTDGERNVGILEYLQEVSL